MSGIKCPYCHNPADQLIALDPELKVRMTAQAGSAPESVCPRCVKKIQDSFGVKKKRAEGQPKPSGIKSKEQQKLDLWRSRVTLVKEARERIAKKDFHKAVVSYEKYFRVLEIIYEVPANGLTAKFFDNPGRAKEMTVLAGAYWDLARIYDNAPQYKPRLEQICLKISEFLPLTPLYEDISEDIVTYRESAKNKDTFDNLLTALKKKRRRCFIATAAFEDPDAPTVVVLSLFRDRVLQQTRAGKAFTDIYYLLSPPIAEVLDRSPKLRKITRKTLNGVALRLEQKFNLKS